MEPKVVAYIVSDADGRYVGRHTNEVEALVQAVELEGSSVGMEFEDGTVTFET